jgi:hypothetical protein
VPATKKDFLALQKQFDSDMVVLYNETATITLKMAAGQKQVNLLEKVQGQILSDLKVVKRELRINFQVVTENFFRVVQTMHTLRMGEALNVVNMNYLGSHMKLSSSLHDTAAKYGWTVDDNKCIDVPDEKPFAQIVTIADVIGKEVQPSTVAPIAIFNATPAPDAKFVGAAMSTFEMAVIAIVIVIVLLLLIGMYVYFRRSKTRAVTSAVDIMSRQRPPTVTQQQTKGSRKA